VIWSRSRHSQAGSLSDTDADAGGRYKVPHFDAKGEADRIFTELGVPTTFLLTSFYWDNLIHFGMGPKKGADGRLTITFPMGSARLAGIASEDIAGVPTASSRRGGTSSQDRGDRRRAPDLHPDGRCARKGARPAGAVQ